MKYFSEQDINEVRVATTEAEMAKNRKLEYQNFYISLREKILKDIAQGHEVFKDIVKEYPELASSNKTLRKIETYERGFIGIKIKKTYYFYNLGLIIHYGYDSKGIVVDQRGDLFYCDYSNLTNQYYAGRYSDKMFNLALDDGIKIRNNNWRGDTRLELNVCETLIHFLIRCVYGDDIVQSTSDTDEGVTTNEHWLLSSTIENYQCIKAPEMLPKDSIISNIVDYLKKI